MARITTNAIAKLRKNKTIQVEVLAMICKELKCNVEDIMEVIPEKIKIGGQLCFMN